MTRLMKRAAHVRAAALLLFMGGASAAQTLSASVLGPGLENATFAECDGAGHFLYLDAPDRFARDVITFVTTTPRR